MRVLFPRSEQPVQEADSEAQESSWKCSGTVLLVDDEESVRSVAAAMLKRMGLGVVCATNGREALEIVKTGKEQIDLVLLDLAMPYLDGLETFEEMRKVSPDLPVILSSGYDQVDATRNFGVTELSGFVKKPYEFGTLRKELRKILSPDTSQPK